MTLPRKPTGPQPGRKPPTSAARPGAAPPRLPAKPAPGRGVRPPTERAGAGRPAPAAAPGKNNLPLVLGISAGALVLIIIAAVMMSGGESNERSGAAGRSRASKEEGPARVAPDVSGLEATGKSKCDEGLRLVESRATPDPSAPKDRVLDDLEKGILLLNDGLDAYKKATSLAGKKYDTGRFERARQVAVTMFCTDLEKDGLASCDQGLALIKSTAGMLTGKELSDDDKAKLKQDLSKGKSLISSGFELMSRVERVSGRKFDNSQYQEALLIARKKLPELQ